MVPIRKACDGNDRSGNEELGVKHPFSESIDVSSITEGVTCVIHASYAAYANTKSVPNVVKFVRCRYERS